MLAFFSFVIRVISTLLLALHALEVKLVMALLRSLILTFASTVSIVLGIIMSPFLFASNIILPIKLEISVLTLVPSSFSFIKDK